MGSGFVSENTSVPYVVHESGMARLSRIIKWLCIIITLLVVLLVGSNIAWIVYESQFEDIYIDQQVEQEADNGGTNNSSLNIGNKND